MNDQFFRRLNTQEEQEFREWARENWAPGDLVEAVWHPVVRDECARMLEREHASAAIVAGEE